MKKRFLGPLASILAMLLLITSRVMSGKPFDWLTYAAIFVILGTIVVIVIEFKKGK